MTIIRGPDPDKTSYRFAINKQIRRWREELRIKWVQYMGETSAQEIDAEIERGMNPNNLDDATHARDFAAFLDSTFDRFEHVISTKEQQEQNLSKYKELVAERRLPGPHEALKRAKDNAKGNRGQGLDLARIEEVMTEGYSDTQREDLERWRWHDSFEDIDRQYGFITEVEEGLFLGRPSRKVTVKMRKGQTVRATYVLDPAQNYFDGLAKHRDAEVRFNLTRGQGLIFAKDGPTVKLLALEVTGTRPMHTNFPNLKVTVPRADLEDLDEEDQARLAHVHELAGIYNKHVDDRTPDQVAAEDERRGALSAAKSKEQTKKDAGYVNQFNDDATGKAIAGIPEGEKITLEKASELLTVIYKGAGFEVKDVIVTPDVVRIEYLDKYGETKRIVNRTPDDLKAVLKETP
jgi:hypothetical protein